MMSKKKRNHFPDIVQVVWKDSYGLGDDWYSLDYAPEVRVLSTCGYKVKEDDEYIVIAAIYDNDAQVFGTAVSILKTCILSQRTYTA